MGHADAQTGPVPAVGMSTGFDQITGSPPSRLDIRVLSETGGPMWDLFIRGLDAIQKRPEDDERSHFQLAGIHGRPYIPYNGVGPVNGGPTWGGYCPHMSPQLISWHRAYLVLFEQILGEEIQRLASEYTGNNVSAYREASQRFRLPFWDWASDPSLPTCTTQENITVNGPDGQLVLHNPLYSYRWQTYPLDATLFPGQGNMGPSTTRDDPISANNNLLAAAYSIKDSVYRTFSSSRTYDQMASMNGAGSSFEQPHNLIHNLVGASFMNLDFTAFDALFILHHSNLDRLAALWSIVHNETVQAEPYTSQGLYATAKGELITADSPLKPFFQADGKTFHTGRTVATTEAFGYTYPEYGALAKDQGRREKIVAQINRLYGNPNTVGNIGFTAKPKREYFVDIQVERADLPLPCSIDVYLGNYLAGRVPFLSMPQAGRAHDELPLSRAIHRLEDSSDDLREVKRILMHGLHVNVVKGDGTLVDPQGLASLKLEVVGEEVTPPSSEFEFPSVRKREILFSVPASFKRQGRGLRRVGNMFGERRIALAKMNRRWQL